MILASGAPVRAPSFGLAALAVAVSALLAACGGGGGGGGEPYAAPQAPASTSQPDTATPTPDPAPDPVPVAPPRTLAAGAELAPTLEAPQPQSTALTGNDSQGIYESRFGYTFISNKGRLNYKDLTQWVFGSVEFEGSNWKFRTPTATRSVYFDTFGRITGFGTVEPRKSMSGEYSKSGESVSSPWGKLDYSAANALAVTQADMAGSWSTTADDGLEMSIEVDASGGLTGRTAGRSIGVCSLSGSIVQTEPATSRNLFDIDFRAANAATGTEKACTLDSVNQYTGLGGVLMVPVSRYPEEGAYRTLYFHSATETFAVVTNNLRKK